MTTTMKVMKIILTFAITMALTLTLTLKNIADEDEKPPFKLNEHPLDTSSKGLASNEMMLMPSKRVSRFLAQNDLEKNPRSSDHCKKDKESCYIHGSKNSTCCNNKCIDVIEMKYDHKNCGACNKKCLFTQACCRGECVYLSFDKRHCGECNNRCMPGGYCIYGMCDYA